MTVFWAPCTTLHHRLHRLHRQLYGTKQRYVYRSLEGQGFHPMTRVARPVVERQRPLSVPSCGYAATSWLVLAYGKHRDASCSRQLWQRTDLVHRRWTFAAVSTPEHSQMRWRCPRAASWLAAKCRRFREFLAARQIRRHRVSGKGLAFCQPKAWRWRATDYYSCSPAFCTQTSLLQFISQSVRYRYITV